MTDPAENAPDQSTPARVYFVSLGLGLLLELAFFVFQLAGYPNERSNWFILILAIVYAVIAGRLSARHRPRAWLLSLSLLFFYLLGWGVGVSALLEQNEKYGHMFWVPRFYWSPVLLFSSIPLAVFFSARFGSKPSRLRFGAVVLVFVVAAVAVPFTEIAPGPARELKYATDIVAPDVALRFELEFFLQVTDDPMRFRTISRPPEVNRRGGWNITILRKNSTFSPDIHMTMTVDGKELESSMWPLNAPNGGSRIDYSQKQDYRDIMHWSVGPNPDLVGSLGNAHEITLTWGNMNTDLSDEQVESLRSFVRNWFQMLRDEDLFCTNPMCRQGAFNR